MIHTGITRQQHKQLQWLLEEVLEGLFTPNTQLPYRQTARILEGRGQPLQRRSTSATNRASQFGQEF